MATIHHLNPSFFRGRARLSITFEPWKLEGEGAADYLRQQIPLLPRDSALTLDLQGAEVSPEVIAIIFFFALDHQDRHGVLQVINVGPNTFALLRRMRAAEMPMVQFSLVDASQGFALH